MCGRYLAYANVPRMCRACDVTPEQSDNPQHVCRFLSMSELDEMCMDALQLYEPNEYGLANEIDDIPEEDIKELKIAAHENLRLRSQHLHLNAFKDIWLGSNTHGLLESLPHDMMHAFQHGVLMYVIEVIMSPFNPTEKYHLDTIVDDIIVPVRSTLKTDYPRCSFTRGITNLTLLTADERVGVAFVLALVAASKPGSAMLKKAAKRIEKASKNSQRVNAEMDENGNPILVQEEGDEAEEDHVIYAERLCQLANSLQMLELLLAFHAWYKRGPPFSLHTKKEKKQVRKEQKKQSKEIYKKKHNNQKRK